MPTFILIGSLIILSNTKNQAWHPYSEKNRQLIKDFADKNVSGEGVIAIQNLRQLAMSGRSFN